MDLSEAKRILDDQNSSKESRQKADLELRRAGYFQIPFREILPEKMFIEIKANPNIKKNEKHLIKDWRYNLMYLVNFEYGETNKPTRWIKFYLFDPSYKTEEIRFNFCENYRDLREHISEDVEEFARSQEFESGLIVYDRLIKILRSQILTE